MPVNQFDDVVEGIIMTVNPVANKKEKDELLSRLHSEDELGIVIDKTRIMANVYKSMTILCRE